MKTLSSRTGIAEIKALAQQGNADAQYKLGWALCCGDTAEEDFDRAMYWFLQAALQGHPKGLWKVGNKFEEDDPKQAIVWYQKSAEAGYSAAQWWLGVKYRQVEGVEQDNRQALYWFQKVAEQDDAAACESLGRMYEAGEGVEQNWQQAASWYKRAAYCYRVECHDVSSCLHSATD